MTNILETELNHVFYNLRLCLLDTSGRLASDEDFCCLPTRQLHFLISKPQRFQRKVAALAYTTKQHIYCCFYTAA